MKKNFYSKNLSTKILFFERSPYMSVEILDLLDNYKIICYNDDSTYSLLKEKWYLFSYLNYTKIRPKEELENDQAIEILLGDQDFINKIVQDKKNSKALFFYMNSNMDALLKQTGISMVLPSYKIQEKLGNKLHLSQICKKLNIISNKDLVFKQVPEEIHKTFLQCQNTLGLPFVVQGALGASGGDTFLISSEKEFKKAVKKINAELKVSKFLNNNIPLSVHICILEDQIIIHGPFLQLMGLPELSANPFQFGGNDTNQSLLTQDFSKRVRDITFKIAKYVKAKGFRGIFGIDYLWDQDTNIVYPQELNTRLVGLTRLLTGMQRDQDIFPDLLRHIEAFSVPCYSQKCKKMCQKDIDFSQHDYSQVIIRNNSGKTINIPKNIEPSIYRIKGNILKNVKPSLFVHDMENDDILITYAVQKDSEVYPGEALARIILKQSVLQNNKYKLEPKAVKIIELIRKNILGL